MSLMRLMMMAIVVSLLFLGRTRRAARVRVGKRGGGGLVGRASRVCTSPNVYVDISLMMLGAASGDKNGC